MILPIDHTNTGDGAIDLPSFAIHTHGYTLGLRSWKVRWTLALLPTALTHTRDRKPSDITPQKRVDPCHRRVAVSWLMGFQLFGFLRRRHNVRRRPRWGLRLPARGHCAREVTVGYPWWVSVYGRGRCFLGSGGGCRIYSGVAKILLNGGSMSVRRSAGVPRWV